MEQAQADEIRKAFEDTTAEALRRGVFGSPWYVVDSEPFWGQDRLGLVERKVAGGLADRRFAPPKTRDV